MQIQRLSSGERVITRIEYVGGYADNNIQHDTLFASHTPRGVQPHVLREKIESAGYEYNPEWFLGHDIAS